MPTIAWRHSQQSICCSCSGLQLGVNNLHVVMTTIVDFKGHRIIGQSILPGILYQGKQGARLMYGALETNTTLKAKVPFHEAMKELGKRLNIAERMVSARPFQKDESEQDNNTAAQHDAPGVDAAHHSM